MRKTILNKLLALLLVFLLAFTIVGCNNNNGNNGNNGNNNGEPQITLPTETLQKQKDEIIYVNMKEDGEVESIKATNRIKNSEFAYYQDYGKFLTDGHLNISSGRGPILIEGEKALIPSLQNDDNMFYTMALDKDYYEPLIPYKIKATYKLNNKEVDYDELKGASGQIELNFNFKPNMDADPYYLASYAAQVQIPLNIDVADITEANGAMQKVLVGKVMTLAYMVMPAQETDINIKLEAKNFYFEGFQAVLQPFDLNSMMSFLPLDDLISLDISDYPEQLNLLVLILNGVNQQVSPLFNELLPMLPNIANEFTALQGLKDGLEDPMLTQFFMLLADVNTYNPEQLANMEGIGLLLNSINLSLLSLSENYDLVSNVLQDLLQIDFGFVDEYQQLYNNAFSELLTDFDIIIGGLEAVAENLDFSDLSALLEQKEALIQVFGEIGQANLQIKTNLQTLISEMFVFPNILKPVVDQLLSLIEPLSNLFIDIAALEGAFTELASKLTEGLANNWFIDDPIIQQSIQMFNQMLTKTSPTLENPGLIQGLQLALMGAGELDQLVELEALFEVDLTTNLRQIDNVAHMFMQINQALSLPLLDMDISFYEGMDLFKLIIPILNLIPEGPSGTLPSFLSNQNLEPSTVQFILKQKGF